MYNPTYARVVQRTEQGPSKSWMGFRLPPWVPNDSVAKMERQWTATPRISVRPRAESPKPRPEQSGYSRRVAAQCEV